MTDHINYDEAYNAVDRDDFAQLIEVDRYGSRSDDFDAIISATVDHFWDPTDPAYIDFSEPFDQKEQTIMPRDFTVELNCAVVDRLDEGQQIALGNEVTRFMLSQILHGEQGALSLSASLCQILKDPGAMEYAANQTREEARHVAGYSRYIQARYGKPLQVGKFLGGLMQEIVLAPEVYKKLVGMQMLIEGLAMGAFATIHRKSCDPVLRRLTQLVMTDEAFHHKFGRIWADKTVPKLNTEEHEKIEDWAAHCFTTLLDNLVNAEQKQEIYPQFGLDWQWVRSAVREAFTNKDRRRTMSESTNIFRVLIKTLHNAGIITERTRPVYAAWIDMEELHAEGDHMDGYDIAEEGIAYLRDINQGRNRNRRQTAAAG